MVATYSSGTNTFTPDFEASGKLAIGFTRNVNKFALNRYVQIIPVKQTLGYYLNLTAEEAARIVGADAEEFDWPDGSDAPSGVDGTESFEFLPYRCRRMAYAARLGDLASSQAQWAISDQHLAIKAQQAMTRRTMMVVNQLNTTSNYASSHVVAVASLSDSDFGANSGTWAASTSTRQDIKRSLNYAATLINRDTLGVVQQNDLILVLNPTSAAVISQTQEIVDVIKQSPVAMAYIKGEGDFRGNNPNAAYGLPAYLYGYEIVVEDAVRVSTQKGATQARGYLWPGANAVLCSRPGGLVGQPNTPNFSTACLFCYSPDDMAVETLKDVNNRRTVSRVVDNIDARLTAPASGVIFTGIR
jgi:hypothetical protein